MRMSETASGGRVAGGMVIGVVAEEGLVSVEVESRVEDDVILKYQVRT